jgi:hypothetical protein
MGTRRADLVRVRVCAAGAAVSGPFPYPWMRRRGCGAGAGHPGVGSADLVCVDAEGTLTIIECKLKANPQIHREVLGHIIAYASGLASTTYEQFDVAFTNRSGTPLLVSVSAAAGAAIDAASLRTAVAERLSTGAFRLVMAVDQITDELRRSVEYLNQHL